MECFIFIFIFIFILFPGVIVNFSHQLQNNNK